MSAEVRTSDVVPLDDDESSPFLARHAFVIGNPLLGTPVPSDRPFQLINPNGAYVRNIQVWLGRIANQNPLGVVGLRLTFEDNTHLQAGAIQGNAQSTFTLPRGELIQRFVIWAGVHIDRFEITPTRGALFTSGNVSGSPNVQYVGNGRFIGFLGTAAHDRITSISAFFEIGGINSTFFHAAFNE